MMKNYHVVRKEGLILKETEQSKFHLSGMSDE